MFDKRIIIGGLPRSGSTLLRFILDASSKVISGPETSFFMRPLSESLKLKEKIFPRLAERLDLAEKEIESCMENCTTTFQAFDLLMCKYRQMTTKSDRGSHGKIDKSIWAEKSPRNCFHYNRILSENKGLYFISTVRNGLDVVTSEFPCADKRYTDRRYWVSVQQYIDCMRAVYSFNHSRHFIIKYEDLCLDADKTVRALFNFLKVDYDEDMLDKWGQESITRNRNKVTQPKLIHPIQSTWIDRWRDQSHENIVNSFLENNVAMHYFNLSGYSLYQKGTGDRLT